MPGNRPKGRERFCSVHVSTSTRRKPTNVDVNSSARMAVTKPGLFGTGMYGISPLGCFEAQGLRAAVALDVPFAGWAHSDGCGGGGYSLWRWRWIPRAARRANWRFVLAG
jgi:hypothetical protein